MTTINLKDFYYWYIQDQFIEVSLTETGRCFFWVSENS